MHVSPVGVIVSGIIPEYIGDPCGERDLGLGSLQVALTDERVVLEEEIDSLTQAKVRLKTMRALKDVDLDALVNAGSWQKIREVLEEYLSVQLSKY